MSSWPSWSHEDRNPAFAVGGVIGDNVCVTCNTMGEPHPLPSTELLDYLHQIVNHPEVPDTVKADARDYLQYLEAAQPDPGSLTGEARMTMAATVALQHGREVVQRLPLPQCRAS